MTHRRMISILMLTAMLLSAAVAFAQEAAPAAEAVAVTFTADAVTLEQPEAQTTFGLCATAPADAAPEAAQPAQPETALEAEQPVPAETAPEAEQPGQPETAPEAEQPAQAEQSAQAEQPAQPEAEPILEGETPAEGESLPTETAAVTDASALDLSGVSITTECIADATLAVGDIVTVVAHVCGLDGVAYQMQWQYYDGSAWQDQAGASDGSYSFSLSRTNASYLWRMVVTIA